MSHAEQVHRGEAHTRATGFTQRVENRGTTAPMRETAPMVEKPKRGRPRVGSADVPVQILRRWIASGRSEASVPELIEAIMGELRCSKRSAYRLVRQALDEGTLKIGTTDSGAN